MAPKWCTTANSGRLRPRDRYLCVNSCRTFLDLQQRIQCWSSPHGKKVSHLNYSSDTMISKKEKRDSNRFNNDALQRVVFCNTKNWKGGDEMEPFIWTVSQVLRVNKSSSFSSFQKVFLSSFRQCLRLLGWWWQKTFQRLLKHFLLHQWSYVIDC
jgi:hypothetical protein